MKKDLSRREMLRASVIAGAAGLVPVWLVGCGKKELSCTDTAGLSAADMTMRTTLAYVDASPEPAKACSNCMLYKAGSPDACGGCQVVKGPINPKGYCKSWAAKPA